MTSEQKSTARKVAALVGMIAAVSFAVWMLSGCSTVARTVPAWTQATNAAGEPLTDAATGEPVLTPLLDETGKQVQTVVVRDGEVQYDTVINAEAVDSFAAAASSLPGIGPWVTLIAPLLLAFSGTRVRT
jgi:hypothetical protein